MNNRRFVLDRFNRAACLAAALICFVAAFALTPTEARSRLDEPPMPGSRRAAPDPATNPITIAPERDPFVARAAEDEAPAAAAPGAAPAASVALPPIHFGPLPPNAGAGAFPFARVPVAPGIRVTAIALGDQPSAIVESSGNTHIVGIGDPLAGSTVAAVDRAGVLLADGKRLRLPEKTTP